MKVVKKSFYEMCSSEGSDQEEGLVLLGAGGNLQDWIVGVAETLCAEGISTTSVPKDLWTSAIKLTTTGGRTDLVLMFPDDPKTWKFEIGKLAMWRLHFGDCSWLSDYKGNYASQH